MDPTTNSIVRRFKGAGLAFAIVGVGGAITLGFPEHAHHLALVLAIIFMMYGAYEILPYIRSRKWLTTNALINNIEESWLDIVVSQTASIKHYFPVVDYSYKVGDVLYSSNRVSFEVENIWVPEGGSKYWESWGNTISVYYNPVHPDESVLIRSLDKKRKSHHLAIIVAGIIILLIWVWLVYAI